MIFKVKKSTTPDQYPDMYEIETPKEFDEMVRAIKNFFLKQN